MAAAGGGAVMALVGPTRNPIGGSSSDASSASLVTEESTSKEWQQLLAWLSPTAAGGAAWRQHHSSSHVDPAAVMSVRAVVMALAVCASHMMPATQGVPLPQVGPSMPSWGDVGVLLGNATASRFVTRLMRLLASAQAAVSPAPCHLDPVTALVLGLSRAPSCRPHPTCEQLHTHRRHPSLSSVCCRSCPAQSCRCLCSAPCGTTGRAAWPLSARHCRCCQSALALSY